MAAAPKLVVGALELTTGNATLGAEQAEEAESPGATVPGAAAQGPEAGHPEPEPQGAVLGQRRLSRRDTGAVLLAGNQPRGPSELRRVGRGAELLAGILEEEPRAGARRAPGQWLQVLGGGFSHLDASLCVGLYSLSFMGLLAVYTFFRARIRALKGHAGHSAA